MNKEKKDENINEEGKTVIKEAYRTLDMSKISNKKSKVISCKNALSDVTPINWSDDVLTGKKKIIVGGKTTK